MLKLFTFLFAFFTITVSSAQNLVQNPSFEDHISCPDNDNQLPLATGWRFFNNTTPDYFHECGVVGNNLSGTIPLNFWGYQYAAGGVAYAGLYHKGYIPDIREYIHGNLIAPLQPGQAYRVSMMVSRGGRNMYAADGLAIYFYRDGINGDTTAGDVLSSIIPQADFTDCGVISDSMNWVTLADTIVADSAYKYIVIGSFKPDSLTNIVAIGLGNPGAYYYIDSVVVKPISMFPESVGSIAGTGVSSVSPNPFTTSADISFSNPRSLAYRFDLYNMQGQRVSFMENIREDKFIVERNDLPTGIYYYKLSAPDKQTTYTGKLVIE